MITHGQGGLLNAQCLAHSLDANWHSVMHYLDPMSDLLLVRRLSPWARNEGKSFVKSPKVYVRDTGLLHALRDLGTLNDVLGHPVAGASWERFVIEAPIAAAPSATRPYFYRAQASAEVDLVLEFTPDRRWTMGGGRSKSRRAVRQLLEGASRSHPTTLSRSVGSSYIKGTQPIHARWHRSHHIARCH